MFQLSKLIRLHLCLFFAMTAETLLKKNGQHVAEPNLEAKYDLVRNEVSDVCLGHNGSSDNFMDYKVIA